MLLYKYINIYILLLLLPFMKINKMICLEQEIMDELRKSDNSSQLIENLLRIHFKNTLKKGQNIDENVQIRLQNAKNELKRIKKEKKLSVFLKNLGVDIGVINWLKGQSGNSFDDNNALRWLRQRPDIHITLQELRKVEGLMKDPQYVELFQ